MLEVQLEKILISPIQLVPYVGDAIVLNASAGGIDITAVGAAAEVCQYTGGSVNITAIEFDSDVGGVTITAGLESADAININASNVAGGIDIDSG